MSILLEPAGEGPKLPKGYPTTAAEWWALFDHHKDDLRRIVLGYHPGVRLPRRRAAEISAPGAEAACEAVRKEIAAGTKKDPVTRFDRAAEERDGPALAGLLNEAWFGLPESTSSRGVPGFGALCDLCSESYVLEPEEG